MNDVSRYILAQLGRGTAWDRVILYSRVLGDFVELRQDHLAGTHKHSLTMTEVEKLVSSGIGRGDIKILMKTRHELEASIV